MAETLFDRIGGFEAIAAAADIFYEKVLADASTEPFFNETDMGKQRRKMVGFLTWAFGGPDEYKGKDLRTAHAHLVKDRGMNDDHFDAVATHLQATLVELEVAPALIDEVLQIVGSTRDEVMNR